jgi:hypothetical protein
VDFFEKAVVRHVKTGSDSLLNPFYFYLTYVGFIRVSKRRFTIDCG